MAIFIYPAQPTTIVGVATEATLLDVKTNTEDTVTELQSANTTLSSLATESTVASLATAAAQTDGSQKTQVVDGDGDVVDSTNNALNVHISSSSSPTLTGIVDTNNSTSVPLGANGVFTGVSTDIKDYGTVSVLVASDTAAASGGFKFQFSNDGINWDHTHSFDFAGGNLSYNISAEAHYFRIMYTNNATPQSYFRLQTVLRPTHIAPSQLTIAQPVNDYSLGTVTKGVIYGKTTAGGGSYIAVKVNPSGALTTESTVTSSVLPTGAATEATLSLLNDRLAGSLVPVEHDSIDITYVVAGNGAGEVATVVYKNGVTTVATLTLSYDSNNRVTSVVRS